MTFWLLMIALCAAAVLPVFYSWWKSKRIGVHEFDHDLKLYKSRLKEIERDFSFGRIDSEARDAAVAEEGRRLLRLQQDAEATSDEPEGVSGSRSLAAIAIPVLLAPAFAFYLYSSLGTPPEGRTFLQAVGLQEEQTAPSLNELVEIAEQRLAKNPDDARGWGVLAPVYMRMGRFEDAKNAFRNLIRIEGESPALLLPLAETMVVAANNRVDDEALDIFSKLLTDDPTNHRAGYFVGLAAYQRGDADTARKVWVPIEQNAKGNEPWLEAVRAGLAEISKTDRPALSLSEEQMEQVNAMVEGLASRLSEERGEKSDWTRLIRSYMVLNRQEDALAALERARSLFEGEAEFIASLEDMISNASGTNE